uniref:Uncharacterized protein n=1 Tax=Magnetococcus massalia (strain MO-1) TaxID=451514 RepID=A0A1S7LER8_MAGMO|nr:protein of unknown function [Candidatus Magnetococcus massalia]
MITESVTRKAHPRRGVGWEHEVSCGALASACRLPEGQLRASYRYGREEVASFGHFRADVAILYVATARSHPLRSPST